MAGDQHAGQERGSDAPLPGGPDEVAAPRREPTTVTRLEPVTPMMKQEAGAQALVAQVEANVKAKHYIAKAYPRSIADVRVRMLEAFKRPMLADGAIYAKPIGGKNAEGLSIRFAEEAFRTMGNMIVETLLVSDDDDKRVYQVIGMDIETNASLPVTVVVTKQIERSSTKTDSIILGKRTNSQGKPVYIIKATSEDDYRSKEAAQLQKARRDVILFLIPGDIKEECEQRIRQTMRTRDAEDPKAANNRMAEAFYVLGISTAELEKYLGHALDLTTTAERELCRLHHTALKDGEATWAEIMEAKHSTNTGADAQVGDKVPVAKGASAKLADAVGVKSATPPAGTPTVPERIQKLIDNEKVPEALNDEDREELRQFRGDHPDLFPAAPAPGKKK